MLRWLTDRVSVTSKVCLRFVSDSDKLTDTVVLSDKLVSTDGVVEELALPLPWTALQDAEWVPVKVREALPDIVCDHSDVSVDVTVFDSDSVRDTICVSVREALPARRDTVAICDIVLVLSDEKEMEVVPETAALLHEMDPVFDSVRVV